MNNYMPKETKTLLTTVGELKDHVDTNIEDFRITSDDIHDISLVDPPENIDPITNKRKRQSECLPPVVDIHLKQMVDTRSKTIVSDHLLKTTPLGASQLFSFLKIPTEYFTKHCSDESRSIQLLDRIHKTNIPMILRLGTNREQHEKKLISVVTESYSPTDHGDVASMMKKALPHDKPILITHTPSHEFMKVLIPEEEFFTDDDVRNSSGISIVNSECKLSSLKIMPGLFKYDCENSFLVQGIGYTKKHIGDYDSDFILALRKATEGHKDFRFDFQNAATYAEMIKLPFEAAEYMLRGLKQIPSRAISMIKKSDEWNQARDAGRMINFWDLSNAVTSAAHTAYHTDREKLEYAGGKILAIALSQYE